MRCLWLTLVDPEPRHNGQLIYSGGLIGGLAESGVEVAVVGLARPGRARPPGSRDGNVSWWLADRPLRSRLRSLPSPLPHMASRAWSRELYALLDRLLEQDWDVIVFDGISAGWALDAVLRYSAGRADRPSIVYVSHNHEPSVRDEVARSHPPGPMRLAMAFDSYKVGRLEQRLIEAADLVTAITPHDRDLYLAQWPGAPVEVLTPGYDGRTLDQRRIGRQLPRRAVIVGSFDWIAKRLNLNEFIAVADPMFAAAGAQLQVVGSANPSFLERLRRTTLATEFTGTVDDVGAFMDNARLALVPERHGGGFKLKVLDYIFHRLPILAIDGSVAGVPLKEGESILYFRDHLSLARGVIGVIDDFERLNELQESAYGICRDRFSWLSRGRELRDMLAAA